MRKTTPTIHVALELLKEPTAQHWGYDLHQRTGISTGVLYPVLTRMLDCGWLTTGWQVGSSSPGGRKARRLYKLTASGGQALELMVNEARTDRRFTKLIESYTPSVSPQADER